MFGKGVKIFKLFGFEVKIDFTWLFLAVLITWSLARGVFPNYYDDLSISTYWLMGIAGTVGLFLSVVFHELAHSLVARAHGIPMRGITLFIFGGIAEMHEDAKDPKSELLMAVAGPAASVLIAIVFWGIHWLDVGQTWPSPVHGLLIYLSTINIILAIFNMLPAFPLDGGRVLRAILWSWKDNLRWATKISSRIGSGFGVALIAIGVVSFISGNFINGVWLALIGFFLRWVAQNAYQQLIIRRLLEGDPVKRFMKKDPVTVPSSTPINNLVENYIYQYHFKLFPVVDDSRLIGCVNLKRVKEVPREEWSNRKVADIAEECSEDNTIEADTDAITALSQMNRTQQSRLMVVEDGKLQGVIAVKDLMSFLSHKMALEETG